jgi:hypothetical protein
MWGIVEKSRAHLPLTCTQGGIPLSLTVRSHLHRGGGCQGRPEGGPPSARRRFDWRSLIKGPDNREPTPRGREEVTRGCDKGG